MTAAQWLTWLPSGVLLCAIAAYLWWGLPRLSLRAAAAMSALLGAGMAGAAALGTGGLALPIAALAFGHLGMLAGRAHSPPRPQGAQPEHAPAEAHALAPVAAHAAAPVAAPVAAPAEAPVAAPQPPPLGQPPALQRDTLGRYRIEREIGRGAMGVVYLGLDPQAGRKVALKTMALSRDFEGDALAQARLRFFREAETAGRLDHPGIVAIFESGEDQDLAYIAMQYLTGRDLQAHTSSAQLLPLATVLDIAARVAEALAHAHRQGVVHRDIKPANVMIDLDAGEVKVTDFGIARIADASRTRTGMVLGTPSFMSPEQMSGRRVDGRSDLYSLGVMLYQLLTGALPHQADSMARLMYQIANEPAPDVRLLRPELSEALANVVALALEKRPEMRYADGDQMAHDLRAVAAMETAARAARGGPPPPAAAPEDRASEVRRFDRTAIFARPDPGHNSRF